MTEDDELTICSTGSQHPFIVPTWGIFVDASRRIYLMQQHASSGNAIDYVRAGNSVSEEQLCRWAQHIYSAMDFLGSMAVSHRSIYPKHLMLNRTASGETVAKLSGFRDAVIYWNPDTNSVIPQACKTLLEACSFHAPEMFGSKVGVRYFYFFWRHTYLSFFATNIAKLNNQGWRRVL